MKKTLTSLVAASLLISGSASALLPFDDTGDLYVSMWLDNVVRVLDDDGNVVNELTAPGLSGPRGMAFNPANNDMWLAGEHSDEIYIFNKQGKFKWKFSHPEFNEPLSATFRMSPGIRAKDQEVYISNSGNDPLDPGNPNGDNIMVFDQKGNHLRTFGNPYLVDPNCSAFMVDGTHYNANRLGIKDSSGVIDGIIGRVDKYDANDNFLFSFTTPGMLSLMAVARDPNTPDDGTDDTIWATSGGGDTGIYEFDQNGNLLTSILPADIGEPIVPQGIAFDDDGNFTVVSFTGKVFQFDGDGNFLGSYSAGGFGSRSSARGLVQPTGEDRNDD